MADDPDLPGPGQGADALATQALPVGELLGIGSGPASRMVASSATSSRAMSAIVRGTRTRRRPAQGPVRQAEILEDESRASPRGTGSSATTPTTRTALPGARAPTLSGPSRRSRRRPPDPAEHHARPAR